MDVLSGRDQLGEKEIQQEKKGKNGMKGIQGMKEGREKEWEKKTK